MLLILLYVFGVCVFFCFTYFPFFSLFILFLLFKFVLMLSLFVNSSSRFSRLFGSLFEFYAFCYLFYAHWLLLLFC